MLFSPLYIACIVKLRAIGVIRWQFSLQLQINQSAHNINSLNWSHQE